MKRCSGMNVMVTTNVKKCYTDLKKRISQSVGCSGRALLLYGLGQCGLFHTISYCRMSN